MGTSSRRPSSKLAPGQIRFYDNFVPTLRDGKFTILVQQDLTGATDQQFSAKQHFEVNGPRWTIPASLIHSSMPPPGHSGRFEEQLPHIVLKARSLPWERYLDEDKADADAPWMGLMLFDAGDGARASAHVNGGAVQDVTVDNGGSGYEIAPAVTFHGGGGSGATALATIDSNRGVTGIKLTSGGSGYTTAPAVKIGSTSNTSTVTLADLLAPGNDASDMPIAAPDIVLNDFDKPTDSCQVIDITTSTFAAYAPVYDSKGAADELKLSAHVRQVSTGDKEQLRTKQADGWFAVLLAKRFPRARDGGKTANRQIAHLVSFEGYGTRMNGQVSAFGTSAMVRLVSLANWTFTCLPETGETFAQLMRDLITTENHSNYLLKPYYDVPDSTITGAVTTARDTLDLGYLPLAYQTRQGEHTFAWYRGPLSPVVPPEFSDEPHLESPSGSVVYDPDSGVFDQSYAVAFQTGRLLALSSRSFGANLLKWRREAHHLVNLLIERLPSVDVADLKTIDAATARGLLEQGVVSGNMMAWLVNDFARRVAPKLSQPTRPKNDPQRPSVPEPGQAIRDLKAALAMPEFQQLLRELSGWDPESKTFSNPRFQQICEWLAKLVLLEGLPFKNLVPASNMLPNGSIRFFYVDPNISKTMIDGAMSVAGQTSRDTLYYAIMRDVIRDAVSVLIHQVRPRALGLPDVTLPEDTDQPMTGFLLRSAAVSGWPGLEVKAFKGFDANGGKDPIHLLRMERLAADVLLVLFPETPAWVQIDEPKEGLAFGIEDREEGNLNPIWIRHLVGDVIGGQFGTDPSTDAIDATSAINQGDGVVNLLTLRRLLAANPRLAAELDDKTYGKGVLTPGDFALQMVKLPEQMVFSNNPARRAPR